MYVQHMTPFLFSELYICMYMYAQRMTPLLFIVNYAWCMTCKEYTTNNRNTSGTTSPNDWLGSCPNGDTTEPRRQ